MSWATPPGTLFQAIAVEARDTVSVPKPIVLDPARLMIEDERPLTETVSPSSKSNPLKLYADTWFSLFQTKVVFS